MAIWPPGQHRIAAILEGILLLKFWRICWSKMKHMEKPLDSIIHSFILSLGHQGLPNGHQGHPFGHHGLPFWSPRFSIQLPSSSHWSLLVTKVFPLVTKVLNIFHPLISDFWSRVWQTKRRTHGPDAHTYCLLYKYRFNQKETIFG